MEITYERYLPSQAEELVAFLAGDTWPFHGSAVVDVAAAERWLRDGLFDSRSCRSFWIGAGDGERAGLIRLMDLEDDTPLFDLRIRSPYRRRGLGGHALTWLTRYLFTELPDIRRIEGTTRQDNVAMRRTFRRCGYVKEAHYRDAWPAPDGELRDAVGYAILRRDWTSGGTSLPDWDDEHLLDATEA